MEALPIRHICQVEILTRDIGRSAAFYRSCFDWLLHPVSEDYVLIDTGAEPVAAIMSAPNPGWPLMVLHYVLVPDCEKAGLFATALGGRICVEKTEVGSAGAYVGTLDPFGNPLFFWQPAGAFAPKLRGSGANPISWLEIPALDLAQGLSYYARLVRWRFSQVEGQADYAYSPDGGLQRGVGLVGGERAARMRGTTSYITVADLERTAARITEAGGTVLRQRSEIPGEGAFLLFADPQGLRWGAFQPA